MLNFFGGGGGGRGVFLTTILLIAYNLPSEGDNLKSHN
jgi:hypothetical protein